ncbi:hypothetical protein EDC04DRAFT_2767583 [Pisolithus marmoratus]|nr:hypothetical protein EDC04DRAFT_2767583 [Pisolithus marmoratus]
MTALSDGRPDETDMGFPGYRLIAGDRRDKSRGLRMDEPEFESCSQAKRSAQPAEVAIMTQTMSITCHDCPADIVQYEFFKEFSVSLSQRPLSF